MNDEQYLKSVRSARELTPEQLKAKYGIPDDLAPSILAGKTGTEDFFFPRRTNPIASELVASAYENSMNNGDAPEQRRKLMSMLIPIIAKGFAAGPVSERSETEPTKKLGEIRDELRRMIQDAE